VVINLLAGDCLGDLSDALGCEVRLEKTVLGEVGYHPKTKMPARPIIEEFARSGALRIVSMSEKETAEFVRLVSAGEPDDLDDGEAATLACAAEGCCAAVDERKGRRIAARDHPSVRVFTTLDLIFSPLFFAHVGIDRTWQVARDASAIGRMRIPPEWRDFVKSKV